jgi:phosphatidylinositol alpha-1,6-mannosyltransferase
MASTLLLSEVFPPKTGGSGRWFWEIYRRLPRSEIMVAAGEDPRQKQFYSSHDLRLTRLPLSFSTWGIASASGLRQYVGLARRLRRLIKDNHIQQLHCGKCLPEGFLAWLLKRFCGIPYVVYVHGEEMNLATTSRELSWMTRRVLWGADYVIANSRNSCRILREGWELPEQRIRLLHPGVDTEWFQPAPYSDVARAKLGWGKRPVILTVGRLQKRKGQDHLILALKQIKLAVPDILYVIMGDGEERANLDKLVASENLQEHVQFLGEADDVKLLQAYQQCDLFVLPNRQVGNDIEGFGMVLLEAQACGKAVLAGASGGTAETMRIPQTGRVVCCDDPPVLANAIVELMGDREGLNEMGQAAREWVEDKFDWKVMAEEAQRLFNNSANRPILRVCLRSWHSGGRGSRRAGFAAASGSAGASPSPSRTDS